MTAAPVGAEQSVLEAVKKPQKRFWSPLVAIVLAAVTFVGGQFVVSIPFVAYPALRHWTPVQATAWTSGTYVQFAYTLLVEAVTVWAIWQFTRLGGLRLRDLGLNRFRAQAIAWALIGFGAYFAAFVVLASVASALMPELKLDQKQDIGFHQVAGGLQLLVTGISLVVLPPIAEELFFRGFLFTSFRLRMGLIASVILTSLLFAVPHLLESAQPGSLLWVGGIDTFVLSVVLCLLREKTGSLWASILLHAIKNGVTFMSLYVFVNR